MWSPSGQTYPCTQVFGPWARLPGLIRSAAWELSCCACDRVPTATQTWSPANASLQTKPWRQVSGPYAPPPGWRRAAACALSCWAWVRVPGGTQTWSLGPASRHTYPWRQRPAIALLIVTLADPGVMAPTVMLTPFALRVCTGSRLPLCDRIRYVR